MIPAVHNFHSLSLYGLAQRLDTIATCMIQNGNYLDTLTSPPKVYLECPTSSGSKFWTATISFSGLSINWGRCGTTGSTITITDANCFRHNPALELKKRAIAKVNKGYSIIASKTILP